MKLDKLAAINPNLADLIDQYSEAVANVWLENREGCTVDRKEVYLQEAASIELEIIDYLNRSTQPRNL